MRNREKAGLVMMIVPLVGGLGVLLWQAPVSVLIVAGIVAYVGVASWLMAGGR